MLKKILAILFSIFYFGLSSGAVLRMQYCMEKFSFSQKNDGQCGKCGKKEKKNCCKTETKYVKVDKFQKSDLLHFKLAKYVETKPLFFPEQNLVFVKQNQTKSVTIHGPPEISKTPIFIQNCNFRI